MVLCASFNLITAQTASNGVTSHEPDFPRATLGLAIGGGGILGFTARGYITSKIAVDAGVYYRPFFGIDEYDDFHFGNGVMVAGGPVFYFKRFQQYSNTVKANGIFIKGGHSFSKYSESFAAIGWATEKYRKSGKVFSAELGVGAIFLHSSDDPYLDTEHINYAITNSHVGPLLYWRVSWGWSVGKKHNSHN